MEILKTQTAWRRLIWVMPMSMSVIVALLLWMVEMTRMDPVKLDKLQPKKIADFIMKEPDIETFVVAPVKPPEPLAEPESFDPVEQLQFDESALNMRPEITFDRIKVPKLEIANSISYMGLGRRKVLGSRAKPSYPREAKSAQVEGSVYLEYDINRSGIPTNIRVLESKPVGVFDQAAISAVKRWRYARKVSKGVSIATPNFRNRINFRLDELNLARQ